MYFDCARVIITKFFWWVIFFSKDVVRKVFTNILVSTQDLRQENRNDCIFWVKWFMMLLMKYIDIMKFFRRYLLLQIYDDNVNNLHELEASWELVQLMKNKYPHMFEDESQ